MDIDSNHWLWNLLYNMVNNDVSTNPMIEDRHIDDSMNRDEDTRDNSSNIVYRSLNNQLKIEREKNGYRTYIVILIEIISIRT